MYAKIDQKTKKTNIYIKKYYYINKYRANLVKQFSTKSFISTQKGFSYLYPSISLDSGLVTVYKLLTNQIRESVYHVTSRRFVDYCHRVIVV